ncbi:MAG: 3-oxoacyl-ACP reductase family protein [Actinomycetota bacterium]
MNLSGKVAFVIGASGGIGAECAKALASGDARIVVGFNENKEAAQETSEACPGSHVVRIDVRDRASVSGAFDETETILGPASILVNAAGITRDRPLLKMSDEEWQEVIETNLSGAFFTVRRALKPMIRAGWGRVVTIGSVAGHLGNAGQANYAAAKAGIVGFTKAVSKEVARAGITVNVVAPGLVETELTEPLSEKARDSILQRTLIKRPATPREVAEAVTFCVDSGYMTGQTILLDGGMT